MSTPTSSKIDFRSLFIVFLGLIGGQVIFAAVAYFLNSTGNNEPSMANADFAYLVPLVLLACFLGAYFWDRSRSSTNTQVKEELKQRMDHYRTTVVVRLAILEGANILSIIAYLLTNEYVYLVYFALGLGASLAFRPSRGQFQQRYLVSNRDMERI